MPLFSPSPNKKKLRWILDSALLPHENAEIEISGVVEFSIRILGNDGSTKREQFVENVEEDDVGYGHVTRFRDA